jgi:hypothetical protein
MANENLQRPKQSATAPLSPPEESMAATTVTYWGSLTEFHGRTFTAEPCHCGMAEEACPYGRFQLADPDGEVVLEHVRPNSIRRMAPDGPLHRPAKDGDLVELGRPLAGNPRPVVRFAYAEPGPTSLYTRVHYYTRSGKRWYISSALAAYNGAPIVRARYTSPADLRLWHLDVDISDALADLEKNLSRRDGEYFWDEAQYAAAADQLERLTYQREQAASAQETTTAPSAPARLAERPYGG